MYGKHVELLKSIAPAETRVGGLRNLTYYQQSPGHGPYVSAVSESARRLGLGLRFFDIRSLGDIEDAFRQMARTGIRAIFVLPDPATFTHSRQIASLAVRSRISSVYGYRDAVEAGGLLSYGPDIREAPRRAAIDLDRIFKGAKPGDLPVEQPTRFELVINLPRPSAWRSRGRSSCARIR
jgi:putative ABC transport system substrate-binding protein